MNSKTFLGWKINGDFTPEEANALQADADVIEEVMYERLKQYNKWSDQSDRRQHEFVAIAGEEFGEVCQDINDLAYLELSDEQYHKHLLNLRNEWLQLAAVAVQAVVAVDKLLEHYKQ